MGVRRRGGGEGAFDATQSVESKHINKTTTEHDAQPLKPSTNNTHILGLGLVLGVLASILTQFVYYLILTSYSRRHQQQQYAGSDLNLSDLKPNITENDSIFEVQQPQTEFGSHNDYLVIGAGPAGLQLGVFLQQAGHDYRIIERSETVGSFFASFPRHGKLISLNKRYTSKVDPEFNLRHDWNSLLGGNDSSSPLMRQFSTEMFPTREAYVNYLTEFYRHHDLRVELNRTIIKVSRHNFDDGDGAIHEGFTVESSDGTQTTCRYLVICTAFQKPYIPDIPGIEHAEGYETFNADPESFTDKRVLILGLGNSAFETAASLQDHAGYTHLLGRSRGGLRFAFKTHYVGDLRAVNDAVLDTFLLKSLDTVDVNFDIMEGNTTLVKDDQGQIWLQSEALQHNLNYRDPYDRVIRCLGWRFDADMFDEEVRPSMKAGYHVGAGKFPAMTDAYMSVNVPNLYFGGTLMHSHDFKKSAGGFVHGFRYLVRSLSRMFDLNHHEKQWPLEMVALTPEGMSAAFHERMRTSSGLYQMFGVLADILIVPNEAPVAVHLQEVPLAFLHNSLSSGADFQLVFSFHFDYGHDGPDGYADNSKATIEPGRAHKSQFLHPIIRAYKPMDQSKESEGGLTQVAEFHVLEDLLASWDVSSVHRDLMQAFMTRVLQGDYTTQEQQLQQFATRVKATFTAEEREQETVKKDPFYGTLVFEPDLPSKR